MYSNIKVNKVFINNKQLRKIRNSDKGIKGLERRSISH